MERLIVYQSADTLNISDINNLNNPGVLRLAHFIVQEIRRKYLHTVVIEGPPGVGKTTLMNHLKKQMHALGISHDNVSTDDDVIPREEREGKEIFDFHPGAVLQEALALKKFGGGIMKYYKYNSETGRQDIPVSSRVKASNDAVMLVEGIRAMEYTLACYRTLRTDISQRLLLVLLKKPNEVIEKQRAMRDQVIKGLSLDEINRRISSQRGALVDYYNDLEKKLSLTNNIRIQKGSDIVNLNQPNHLLDHRGWPVGSQSSLPR